MPTIPVTLPPGRAGAPPGRGSAPPEPAPGDFAALLDQTTARTAPAEGHQPRGAASERHAHAPGEHPSADEPVTAEAGAEPAAPAEAAPGPERATAPAGDADQPPAGDDHPKLPDPSALPVTGPTAPPSELQAAALAEAQAALAAPGEPADGPPAGGAPTDVTADMAAPGPRVPAHRHQQAWGANDAPLAAEPGASATAAPAPAVPGAPGAADATRADAATVPAQAIASAVEAPAAQAPPAQAAATAEAQSHDDAERRARALPLPAGLEGAAPKDDAARPGSGAPQPDAGDGRSADDRARPEVAGPRRATSAAPSAQGATDVTQATSAGAPPDPGAIAPGPATDPAAVAPATATGAPAPATAAAAASPAASSAPPTPAPSAQATAPAPPQAHTAPASAPPQHHVPHLTPASMQQTVERVRELVRISALRDGSARAVLQLKPVELGTVDVQLRTTREGLVATIVARDEAGLQALQQTGGELRRSLEDRGVALHRLDLQLSPGADGSGAGHARSGGAWAGSDRSGAAVGRSDTSFGDEPAGDDELLVATVRHARAGALVDVQA